MIDPEATKKRVRQQLEGSDVEEQLHKAYLNLQKAFDADCGILAAQRKLQKAGEIYWRRASKIWKDNMVYFKC